MAEITRHAYHDPTLICRPAGHGLCELLTVPAPGAGTPAATAPGRAAYDALYGVTMPGWEALDDRQRALWEDAAQAAISAYVEANHGAVTFELGTTRRLLEEREQERDSLTGRVAELVTEVNQLRELVASIRDRLESFAADLETSAQATHPSKKSEIEHRHALAVMRLADGLPAAGDSRDGTAAG